MTDICSSSQSPINSSQADTSKFVIPKKTNSQQYSLTELENDEKEILERTLNKSNFDIVNSLSAYKRTLMKRIDNKTLEDEYTRRLNNKKAEIFESNKKLHNLRNKTSLIERELFYVVRSDAEMMDIVKNGFTCSQSDENDLNVLGSAAYGLHMSKHLDIILMYQYYLKLKSFYIIVVKTFYSGFRLSAPVPEKNKLSYPDPTDGFEMSNQLPHKDQPIKVRYYNSLVYLFDCDQDLNIVEKPRNIFPWAVLKYDESLSIDREFINLYINPNSEDLKNRIKSKKHSRSTLKPKIIESKTTSPIVKQPQPFRFRPQHPSSVTFSPSISSITAKQTESFTHIPAQPVTNHNPSSNQHIAPILPKFDKSESSDGLKKKLISVFGSEGSDSEHEESSDDENWADFCYQYYMENFSDIIEEIHAKPPRWRVIYERTGRLNVKFKSEKQLNKNKKYKGDSRYEVRLEDIRKTKLKFIDADKSKVNLKDPTNNLILTYHLKRKKNQTSSIKTEPNTQIITQAKTNSSTKEQKSERLKKIAEYSQMLSEIKKKNEKSEPKSEAMPMQKKIKNEHQNVADETSSAKAVMMNQKKDQSKCFWEPDKNSEFYLSRIRTEKCEPLTDVLILTRLSLNKKITIEYSKQYYDSNTILFESEMQKFVRLNKSIFPCDDWTKSKVESHIKVPLRPNVEPQTRREKFRQKYVHHIKTRNLLSEFQVDNLSKYAQLRDRIEIHAGGFNGLIVESRDKQSLESTELTAESSDQNHTGDKCQLNSEHCEPEQGMQVEAAGESGLRLPVVVASEPDISIPVKPPDDHAKKIAETNTDLDRDTDKVKKRSKHKKKIKHKKKKIKKLLHTSSSDSSIDSSPDVRHKKSKYSDQTESDSDEHRHRHKHRHKHKHKRSKSKNDDNDPNYEYPTYDIDLGDGLIEHEIKTELDDFMSGSFHAKIDDDKSNQSNLSFSKPVVETKEVDWGIAINDGSRSECVRSNESTPSTQSKFSSFQTPENQRQCSKAQFSSAPGFRFNRPMSNETQLQQHSSLNGCTVRNTSSANSQAACASSLKVYRFNPVKTLQSKQNTDSKNPSASLVCKQDILK